eukprot:GHVU01133114.1.p2 GENE.GHVU01133114.1~~GHVU01133114.1.p2  ORF type:complete len:170 (+),score=15.33 GHVU01133114.1:124-633(+)
MSVCLSSSLFLCSPICAHVEMIDTGLLQSDTQLRPLPVPPAFRISVHQPDMRVCTPVYTHTYVYVFKYYEVYTHVCVCVCVCACVCVWGPCVCGVCLTHPPRRYNDPLEFDFWNVFNLSLIPENIMRILYRTMGSMHALAPDPEVRESVRSEGGREWVNEGMGRGGVSE